jgi:CrcB protein
MPRRGMRRCPRRARSAVARAPHPARARSRRAALPSPRCGPCCSSPSAAPSAPRRATSPGSRSPGPSLHFPWATLAVNVVGAFALGVLVGATPPTAASRLALGAGVCGGFTTFSTYAVEAVALAERGLPGRAGAYAVGERDGRRARRRRRARGGPPAGERALAQRQRGAAAPERRPRALSARRVRRARPPPRAAPRRRG